jgi:hypothetical protein
VSCEPIGREHLIDELTQGAQISIQQAQRPLLFRLRALLQRCYGDETRQR